METGKILRNITVKDGRNVVLRTPRREDLDDMLDLINSLVEEKAEILVTTRFTRKAEADWLRGALSRLERDELFFLVAEVDKMVVASSDFQIRGVDEEYVGAIGIIVKNGYRGIGIGTEILKILLEQARAFGLRVLTVHAFATNKRAIRVYEKFGFVQSGRIPKRHFRQGRFIDEVVMTKLTG